MKTYLYPYFTLICFCLHTTAAYAKTSQAKPQLNQPNVLKNSKFEIEGDFLYWKVKQNGNEFAQTGQAINPPGINGITDCP